MIRIALESAFCSYPSLLIALFNSDNGAQAYTSLGPSTASDAQWSARADQTQANADIMKPNPVPKPHVVEAFVGLLFWKVIL